MFSFFFKDTSTTEIYTLSLHDALPISCAPSNLLVENPGFAGNVSEGAVPAKPGLDRKSTRLNSSHVEISYAVFCLKKKKQHTRHSRRQPQRSNTAESRTSALRSRKEIL